MCVTICIKFMPLEVCFRGPFDVTSESPLEFRISQAADVCLPMRPFDREQIKKLYELQAKSSTRLLWKGPFMEG